MIQKVLIISCCLILVNAGILGTDYSPATSVSYSSFSSSPVITKAIETPVVGKVYDQPIQYAGINTVAAPAYGSVLTTQESNYKTLDGAEHRIFLKSLDSGHSKITKFQSHSTDSDLTYSTPSFSAPAYTEAIFKMGSYSGAVSPPLIRSLSVPTKSVIFTSQSEPSYVTQYTSSLATPIVSNVKVTPGLSTYASSSDYSSSYIGAQPKSVVTFSKSPVVSHVSVSGSGASYFW